MPASDSTAELVAGRNRTPWRRRRPDRDLPSVYYRKDASRILAFIAIVIALRITIIHGQATQNSINLWLLYTVVALGFYLVFGIAGRFAFSQTFMMTLGGYVSAWASLHHSMWLAFVVAIVVTAVVSLVFAMCLIRANEFYFGIATLAIASIGTIVFQSWNGFTGQSGLRYNIVAIGIGGHSANTETQVFWVFVVFLVIGLLITALVERSPLRREAIAARDSAVVAQTLGIPVAVIQVVMFIIGSTFAGAAGSLYAHWQGFMTPTSFGIDLSIGIFLMAIMGGLGSMWGMIIGAAFYVFIPQFLSSLDNYQNIIYGGLLVVVIILLPEGIVGVAGRIRDLRRPPSDATIEQRTSQGILARLGRVVAHAQRPRY